MRRRSLCEVGSSFGSGIFELCLGLVLVVFLRSSRHHESASSFSASELWKDESLGIMANTTVKIDLQHLGSSPNINPNPGLRSPGS